MCLACISSSIPHWCICTHWPVISNSLSQCPKGNAWKKPCICCKLATADWLWLLSHFRAVHLQPAFACIQILAGVWQIYLRRTWYFLLWVLHLSLPLLILELCDPFPFPASVDFALNKDSSFQAHIFYTNHRVRVVAHFLIHTLQSLSTLAVMQYHQRASPALWTTATSIKHRPACTIPV